MNLNVSKVVGASALAVVTVLLSGCGSPLCDRSEKIDLSTKTATCSGMIGSPLGDAKTCGSAIGSCTGDDRATLEVALNCLEALPTCSQANVEAFQAALQACVNHLQSVSSACSMAFASTFPSAQSIDAGPQASLDGGNGVDLIGVSDENNFALAWSTKQKAEVDHWVLMSAADGGRLDDRSEASFSSMSLTVSGVGADASRRFHIAGFTASGELVFGSVDAGAVIDAGFRCRSSFQCSRDEVCDLGECHAQMCDPLESDQTCPSPYTCVVDHCARDTDDGGVIDLPMTMTPNVERALPMVSSPLELTTKPASFSTPRTVGVFPGRRAETLAIDSARVLVVMEQEGQLIAHVSGVRGTNFLDDATTTSLVDTVGARVRLAYNPQSKTVFACYNVGLAVRVRRSLDYGKTWVNGGVLFDAESTQNTTATISDCAIAAWKDGGAILATIDDDRVAVRTLSATLVSTMPQYAFASADQTSGNPYAPARPAIATLPADGIVHITFTAFRALSSTADTEPFGIYRDDTMTTFSPARNLGLTGVGAPGTPFAQDYTTVAIDPVSKRAVAAYTSVEAAGNNQTITTIYISKWNPTTKIWNTGSDLTVFVNGIDGNTSVLFPSKVKADRWDAFSPILAASPTGKVLLSFVAGKRTTVGADLRMYVVPFDYETTSQAGTAKGWFVAPAVSVSTTRIFDPRSGSTTLPRVTSFTADSQISFYGTFIQGAGAEGEIEGLTNYVSRP